MSPSLLVDKTGPVESSSPQLEVIVQARTGLVTGVGRLGVLGGAYNPITRAHLALAHAAVTQFNLDEVMFVLSKMPPQKSVIGTSIDHRLKMMELAVSDLPFVSVGLCTHGLFLEICVAVKQVYPEDPELFFITGRDAAERILTWPYADPARALAEMFAAFHLLVAERQGTFTLPQSPLVQHCASRIHSLSIPENLDQISSTRVRQLIRTGHPAEDLVPHEVFNFIKKHSLYKKLSEG